MSSVKRIIWGFGRCYLEPFMIMALFVRHSRRKLVILVLIPLLIWTLCLSWIYAQHHFSGSNFVAGTIPMLSEKLPVESGINIFGDGVPVNVANTSKVPYYASQWKTYRQSIDIEPVVEFCPKDKPLVPTVDLPYIIPNKGLCSNVPNLTYVVVVHSATYHFKHREILRRTWAQHSVTGSRTVFILGTTPEEEIQEAILRESEEFGDIVQGYFWDTYKNLTLKAVLGLRWLTANCRNAKFVIKTDDDVFVDIPSVKKYVFPILSSNPKHIVCNVYGPYGNITRPGERDYDKWGISNEYFKDLTQFPMPICFGFAVFYTTNLAMDLFQHAKSTPFFVLDDAYVYGIIGSKIPGVTWWDASPVIFRREVDSIWALLQRRTILAGLFESNVVMERIWRCLRALEVLAWLICIGLICVVVKFIKCTL